MTMPHVNCRCGYVGVFVLSNCVCAQSVGNGRIRVLSECITECPHCHTRGKLTWDTMVFNQAPESLDGLFAVHDAEMIINAVE